MALRFEPTMRQRKTAGGGGTPSSGLLTSRSSLGLGGCQASPPGVTAVTARRLAKNQVDGDAGSLTRPLIARPGGPGAGSGGPRGPPSSSSAGMVRCGGPRSPSGGVPSAATARGPRPPVPRAPLRSSARSRVHPVALFMREAGLSQYVDVLLENGFEDIETLLELRDTDLEDLGFQRGHTLKMLKRLRQLGEQVGGGEAAPSCEEGGASVAGPAPKLPIATPPTAQMADAVQRSWAEVQKLGSDAVGDLLYKNLFKLAPDAVSLFPMHVRERYQHWLVDENSVSVELSPALRNLFGKIVGAVGYSVEHVGDIEKLKPALMALGARHFGYQCEASHYQVLQKALIETLGMALGELFTPEVEFAWTVVYGFMSSIMLEGQSQAEQVKKAAEEAADNISASGRFAATPTATGKPSLGGDETTVSTPSVATPTPEERPTILASMRNVGGPEPCTKRQSQVRPTPAALA